MSQGSVVERERERERERFIRKRLNSFVVLSELITVFIEGRVQVFITVSNRRKCP